MRSKVMYLALLGMALSLALAPMAFSENATFSDLIEAKSTICYPLEFTFKRPSAVLTTKLPAVSFSHGQHANLACADCHHMWDGKGPVDSCTTAGCHEVLDSRQDDMSYFKAFHNKDAAYSCLGCHLKMNQERKEHGKDTLKLSPCSNNICHVAQK